MKDDIEQMLENLRKLDGTIHNSRNSDVMWASDSGVFSTKEEAVSQARTDAVKKGQAFAELPDTNLDDADDEAVERYIDDLLRELL